MRAQTINAHKCFTAVGACESSSPWSHICSEKHDVIHKTKSKTYFTVIKKTKSEKLVKFGDLVLRTFSVPLVLWHCWLGVRKSIRPVKIEWWDVGLLVWLFVWSKVQIVCLSSSWCQCHPKTPSSLASFKSRLVLPFWYRLMQVILEKRPLNGCSCSRSSVHCRQTYRKADRYADSKTLYPHSGNSNKKLLYIQPTEKTKQVMYDLLSSYPFVWISCHKSDIRRVVHPYADASVLSVFWSACSVYRRCHIHTVYLRYESACAVWDCVVEQTISRTRSTGRVFLQYGSACEAGVGRQVQTASHKWNTWNPSLQSGLGCEHVDDMPAEMSGYKCGKHVDPAVVLHHQCPSQAWQQWMQVHSSSAVRTTSGHVLSSELGDRRPVQNSSCTVDTLGSLCRCAQGHASADDQCA